MADFKDMWELQAKHQKAIGLAPNELSEPERRLLLTELVALAHEEVSDLGRRVATHKRHLLRMPEVNQMDLAEEIADVLKCVITYAQTSGLEMDKVVDAFYRKTHSMLSRYESERLALSRDTRLVCIDLDDVVVDISKWREGLEAARAKANGPAEVQALEEEFKHEWNSNGHFMNCPPIPGAPESIRAIKEAKFVIAFITARPQWQYKRLMGDTQCWLAEYNVPCDLLLFNKDKCEAIYHHIQPAWPCAFVEDHTRNALALSNIGIDVLLFDQPHNRLMQSNSRIRRVYDWVDVLNHLGIA